MKKAAFNREFAAFTAVVFTSLFFAAVVGAGYNSGAASDAQRQAIENNYKDQISEIQRRADEAVKEINAAEETGREQTEAIKKNRALEDNHWVPSGELISSKEASELEGQRAQKEKKIRDRAQSEIKYLEERKVREIGSLEGSESMTSEQRPRPRPSAVGVLTGIVYCENKGAALICGEIVRENDVVRGVKVVRILPDYVEFEKQGKKWTQEVGKLPPVSVWEESTKTDTRSSTNFIPKTDVNLNPIPNPKTNVSPKPSPKTKANPGSSSNSNSKPKPGDKTRASR